MTSVGCRSGVHWMRDGTAPSIDCAIARASTVLAVPGHVLEEHVPAAGERASGRAGSPRSCRGRRSRCSRESVRRSPSPPRAARRHPPSAAAAHDRSVASRVAYEGRGTTAACKRRSPRAEGDPRTLAPSPVAAGAPSISRSFVPDGPSSGDGDEGVLAPASADRRAPRQAEERDGAVAAAADPTLAIAARGQREPVAAPAAGCARTASLEGSGADRHGDSRRPRPRTPAGRRRRRGGRSRAHARTETARSRAQPRPTVASVRSQSIARRPSPGQTSGVARS